jgi:hypothetical protein
MKEMNLHLKNLLLTSLLLVVALTSTQAQIDKANIIKFNLTSFAVNHYTFQYERVLSPKHSLALGFGFSSDAELPFKNELLDIYGDDEDAKNAIESTRFDKITITPEYRFYLGSKEAPVGFYLAPFVRYMHMSMDQTYYFTTNDGVKHDPVVTGTFDGVGFGGLIGIQWALGKSITLDWWIAGPFYGFMNGKFHGTDDFTDMDAQDAADLEQDIEDVDIPMWTIDATVSGVGTNNGTVDASVDGPYYGVRGFGFALGFRF